MTWNARNDALHCDQSFLSKMQWHKKTVFPRNSSIPDIVLYFCFLRKQMDVEKRYQKKWFCWMDGFRKSLLFATMSHFSISRCFVKFMIADFWDFWRENSNYTVAKWDFFDSLFLKGLKMDPDEGRDEVETESMLCYLFDAHVCTR